MKSISATLLAHLQQDTTSVALLWKVVRQDGVILGFTDHDQTIVFEDNPSQGAVTYAPQDGSTASATDTSSDMNTSSTQLVAFLDSDAITESDIFANKYDYATIEIRLVNYNDLSMGALLWKKATLGEVKTQNGKFIAELRGLEFYLNTNLGETYGPTCRADLGDSRCTIDLSLWIQNGSVGTVSAGLPKQEFTGNPSVGFTMRGSATPFAPAPAGWFSGGVLTWLTGANAGYNIEVGSWDGANFILFEDMPYDIQPGDTFTVEPGCDKSAATCFSKFNNIVNMIAEPQIPGMDQILIYPNAGGAIPG